MRALLLTLVLLALVAPQARGGEVLRYSGEETLYLDTVWSGEVLVDGILTVAPGVTLEIRPGTVVRFTRRDGNGDGIGEHELFIQGTFRALGTKSAPILFTSAEERPIGGDWGALNLMASERENRLEHCVVEYAYRGFHAHFARVDLADSAFRNNVRGIQFQEATVNIESCRIVDNRNGLQFRDSTVTLSRSVVSGNYWGLRCVYSDVTLSQSRIEGNLVNGANLRDSTIDISATRFAANRKGLYLQRSRGVVRDNTLVDNSEHGILLEDSECEVLGNLVADNGRSGVKWVDSLGTLRGNQLEDNGEYALVNDGPGSVDARKNWWQAVSPEEIGSLVRDGEDRPGSGPVAVWPVLTARPASPAMLLPEY